MMEEELTPYTLKPGDTLYTIASDFRILPDGILAANPEGDPDSWIPGEVIQLPMASAETVIQLGMAVHTVAKGDTFYRIARKYNVKITALLKANPYTNPDNLHIGQKLCIPKPWNEFTSPLYGISLRYPYRWSRCNKTRFEGIDGFFQVSCIPNENDLENVCRKEAFHKLKIYGSKPEIVPTEIQGCQGYLIFPSHDQPMEMKSQTALLLKFRKPLEIDGVLHYCLLLWTDKDHFRDIVHSFKWLDI